MCQNQMHHFYYDQQEFMINRTCQIVGFLGSLICIVYTISNCFRILLANNYYGHNSLAKVLLARQLQFNIDISPSC